MFTIIIQNLFLTLIIRFKIIWKLLEITYNLIKILEIIL